MTNDAYVSVDIAARSMRASLGDYSIDADTLDEPVTAVWALAITGLDQLLWLPALGPTVSAFVQNIAAVSSVTLVDDDTAVCRYRIPGDVHAHRPPLLLPDRDALVRYVTWASHHADREWGHAPE